MSCAGFGGWTVSYTHLDVYKRQERRRQGKSEVKARCLTPGLLWKLFSWSAGEVSGIPSVAVKCVDKMCIRDRGLAEGLGITEAVNSPTFTILQVYEEGRLPLYHFDVYRIGDVEEMDEIGYEDYFYGDGVCLIEWANLIEEILPEKYTEIRIEKDLEKGFDYRKITVTEVEA